MRRQGELGHGRFASSRISVWGTEKKFFSFQTASGYNQNDGLDGSVDEGTEVELLQRCGVAESRHYNQFVSGYMHTKRLNSKHSSSLCSLYIHKRYSRMRPGSSRMSVARQGIIRRTKMVSAGDLRQEATKGPTKGPEGGREDPGAGPPAGEMWTPRET